MVVVFGGGGPGRRGEGRRGGGEEIHIMHACTYLPT